MVDHHSGPLRLDDPRPGITFAVDAVEPASKRLAVSDAGTVLTKRLGRAVIAADPGAEHMLTRYDVAGLGLGEGNAFTDAVHLAFGEHRPLVLGPDVVWLTLAQGVAQHVRLHAERLRDRLVEFQGKQTVEILRDLGARRLGVAEWAEIIDELAARIADRVDMEQLPPMLCTFSTTTAASRTASQVVLLEGLRRYFDYVMLGICGFPQITLLGTPSDWQDILGRTAAIEALGLGWWTERLRPILEQIVATAAGSPDVAFWREMYKLPKAYGPASINGWFALLFPYTRQGGQNLPTIRNPLLTGAQPFVTSTELPNGLSHVQLLVNDGGESHPVELVAGLTGVAQDPSTLALTPVVGWAVTEAGVIRRALAELRGNPRHRTWERREDVKWWVLGSVPADIVELYEDFDRIELFVDDSTSTIVLHTPIREPGVARSDSYDELDFPWGLDFGKGPAEHTLCCLDDHRLGGGFCVGVRHGRDEVSIIATSFAAFLARVLAEGAYFARPDFQPLRVLSRPKN